MPPDDPLAPPAPAPPTRPEPERNKKMICQHCGCRLDSNGDVLERGATAAKFLTLEDENAKLKEKLVDLEKKLKPAEPVSGTPSRKGLLV